MKYNFTIAMFLFLSAHVEAQITNWKKGNAEMFELESKGDLKGAVNVGEQTLALVLSKYGIDSEEASIIMGNLGANYVDIEEFTKAKPLLLNASKYESDINGQTEFLASIYTNTGNCYKAEKNNDSSLFYYEKALSIYENVLGQEHLHTTVTKSNLAYNHLDNNNYDIALILFKEVLSSYEDTNDVKYIAYSQHGLATTYLKLNRLEETELYYISAKYTFEKGELLQDPGYGYLLFDYGKFMIEQKQDIKGKALISEALQVAENSFGKDSRFAANLRSDSAKYLDLDINPKP